jgi:hypothetical protein
VALLVSPDAFPSASDPLYLALYPALAIGLGLLIRARSDRVDSGPLIDTTTISTGLGLVTWVLVVRPPAADPGLGLLGRRGPARAQAGAPAARRGPSGAPRYSALSSSVISLTDAFASPNSIAVLSA